MTTRTCPVCERDLPSTEFLSPFACRSCTWSPTPSVPRFAALLADRALRLERLVDLNAPDSIVRNEVELARGALKLVGLAVQRQQEREEREDRQSLN